MQMFTLTPKYATPCYFQEATPDLLSEFLVIRIPNTCTAVFGSDGLLTGLRITIYYT